MKRVFFAIAVFLSVLPSALFLSAPSAQAADPMCLCYHTGQDCTANDPSPGTTNAADCTTLCKGLWGIEYVSDAFESDNSTFSAETARLACLGSHSDAAAATAASASATTRTISYATPELSVAIPGVDFAIPYLKDGRITSNFLATYVAGMYVFLIPFSITVAIIMIMVGGVQYVIGASTGEIGKAKERISNAIIGFTLLMFVYVILFVVNPNLTTFADLSLQVIPEVPTENLIEPSDADSTSQTASGTALLGKNKWQDCMIANFGASASEVKLSTVKFEYLGKSRNYLVNEKAVTDFQNALAAIKASGVQYDITRDTSGGTFSWRANKNNPAVLSSHSWGTAIDVNPDKNPNCPSACFDGDASTACSCVGSGSCRTICESRKGDLPPEVVSAFLNNGFDWLGDRQTSSKPNVMQDYMHFSWSRICPGG